MSENDPVEELLRVLRGGEGSDRLKELARALAAAEQRKRQGPPDRAEVREWLAGNRRENPIAVNHFWTRAEAERFIDQLYSAGAERVWAENIAYHDAEEWGGPYTDSLTVELPREGEARARVIALCNQHCMADASTGAQFLDSGQPLLQLWWD